MIVIAGLGNTERKYENTRHNIGFDVVDVLSRKYGIPVRERKFRGLSGRGVIEGERVMLLKPRTYMNLSGESIRAALEYTGCSAEDLIVICDDINIPLGTLRIRKGGSAGGHNGLKNIILQLGTQDFKRIRVGVGTQPEDMDRVSYVLSHFTKAERIEMDDAAERAAEAAVTMFTEGVDTAMNRFNRKKKET